MAVTTLGRQLVRTVLPANYKSYADGQINKSVLDKLTTKMALEDPDAYVDILQKLNHIGQQVVSTYGKDTTVTLDDLDAGAQIRNARAKLEQIIRNTINRDDLTPKQKQQKVIQLGYKYTAKLKDMGVQDAKDRKTGLANQIASGSRGNPVQLMQLIVGDMMMKDAMNRDIPYLATMPYVQGDSPMSYWASAMSGRKSTYDTQAATGRVGYLSKQVTTTTHNTPIAIRDCQTTDTGLPVKASDPQNIGALLLKPWKKYAAGTPITQDMVAEADDQQEIIVRSPTTCKAHNGVCALCSGIQENGKLPAIGSYVALNAAKTYVQPLTQAGISCLHPGTPVRMADWSIKPIKDIKVGDKVIGVSKEGHTRQVEVLNTFDNGIQPLYCFKFRDTDWNQSAVVCTQQHKFLQLTNKLFQILPIKECIQTSNRVCSTCYFRQEDTVQNTFIQKSFLGYLPTVDIQVDHPDHLFLLGNGLICSNSKHGSGMGGVKNQDPDGQDQPTGFDSIQRMLLAPKVFPGGAILSKVDGRVTEVRKAPQGGSFITVGNTTVYSPIARTVKVKVGDTVEAGDMLTNGVPNPMQVVKYKGIGEGRQYMTNKMAQLLPKTGAGTARRNLQQCSRALINKLRITADEGYGGYFPGDIADYDDIADKWQPRDDSQQKTAKDAIGSYLQQPVLYYSIGTKITPSVSNKLQKYGFNKLLVHKDPPPFEPLFISAKQFSQKDTHWLPRLSGQGLTRSLFDAARTGMTDPYDSPSFVDKIIISPYAPGKNN